MWVSREDQGYVGIIRTSARDRHGTLSGSQGSHCCYIEQQEEEQMGKHLASLPSGRLHRRCFVDLRSTEIVPLTNNSRDCTTGWQNQSDRQTGMPSLQSCNAVEVDKTRASNHYSEFLYPFLYLKLLISTINAHFVASLLCEYIVGS